MPQQRWTTPELGSPHDCTSNLRCRSLHNRHRGKRWEARKGRTIRQKPRAVWTARRLRSEVPTDPEMTQLRALPAFPLLPNHGSQPTPYSFLNQAADDAVKVKGSIFEIAYRRSVSRPGHHQAIGVIAHRQCRRIWLILHPGVGYEECRRAVTKQSRQARTARMIRQLRTLGYRIELENLQLRNPPGR